MTDAAAIARLAELRDALTLAIDAMRAQAPPPPASCPRCNDIGYVAGQWCNDCAKGRQLEAIANTQTEELI